MTTGVQEHGSMHGISDRSRDLAIVLLATAGLADFVENALIGIERCGIDTGLVNIVFPANAEHELSGLARVFGAQPRVLEQLIGTKTLDLPTHYVEYGSPAFSLIMKCRFPALRAIMAEGKSVVYADVDLAWIRNPLPYLSKVLDHYPCAIQTEAYPAFPPPFCLGFSAFANTEQPHQIIDHHIAKFVGDNLQRVSQSLFNEIVAENPQYLTKIFPLPETLFPNGINHRVVSSSDEPSVVLSERLRPFIFHANCTRGLTNKRRLLDRVGLWVVPENASGILTVSDSIPLISLTNFQVLNTAKVKANHHFEVVTPAQKWAYAVSFPMDSTIVSAADFDHSVTVWMQLRVEEGSIGVGLLRPDGREFVVERLIPSGTEYVEVSLRAPMMTKFAELILRNADTDAASRVTVRSINARLSKRIRNVI